MPGLQSQTLSQKQNLDPECSYTVIILCLWLVALVLFPIVIIKYSDKSNVSGEDFILAQSSRL